MSKNPASLKDNKNSMVEISYKALRQILANLYPKDNLTTEIGANPQNVWFRIYYGPNRGSLVYNLNEARAYGFTENWARDFDKILFEIESNTCKNCKAYSKKGKVQLKLFSEEQYNKEKGLDEDRAEYEGMIYVG